LDNDEGMRYGKTPTGTPKVSSYAKMSDSSKQIFKFLNPENLFNDEWSSRSPTSRVMWRINENNKNKRGVSYFDSFNPTKKHPDGNNSDMTVSSEGTPTLG